MEQSREHVNTPNSVCNEIQIQINNLNAKITCVYELPLNIEIITPCVHEMLLNTEITACVYEVTLNIGIITPCIHEMLK